MHGGDRAQVLQQVEAGPQRLERDVTRMQVQKRRSVGGRACDRACGQQPGRARPMLDEHMAAEHTAECLAERAGDLIERTAGRRRKQQARRGRPVARARRCTLPGAPQWPGGVSSSRRGQAGRQAGQVHALDEALKASLVAQIEPTRVVAQV